MRGAFSGCARHHRRYSVQQRHSEKDVALVAVGRGKRLSTTRGSSDSDTTVGACAGARDGAAGAAEVALAEEEDAALLQSTQTQHLIPRYVGETLALVILGSTAAFARGTSSHTPVSDARVKWGVY